ncbi:hypothetical protein MRB53_040638 [Persea americana]|nr:hypothetical protein MRB53_040638 [Persea americana]
MWILTCDSDLLEHKALWLQPKSRHLLGRTNSNKSDKTAQVRYIDHKTISRQHLVIKVDEVARGDSAHFLTRSRITLTDNSKAGTSINGIRISKTEKVLDKAENVVRLGSSEHIFHINWVPKVLTFTNIPKSLKASRDALATYRESLEQMDIKLVTEYISNHTTHVVATKRNTTACLQALAQAKWMVSYSFVDALIAIVATRGKDEHGDDIPSALIEDFNAHWPPEKQHPVPAGTEPVQRPDELLSPDPRRSEIFDGLSFIFMSASQYDNLMAPITACGGKAILQEPEPETTIPEEYMSKIVELTKTRKVRSTVNNFENVIMIRSGETTSHIEWWTEFNTEVQLISNRRSILQGELLDAIVMLNTTTLQQTLPEELQISNTEKSRLETTMPQQIESNAGSSKEGSTKDSSNSIPNKSTKRLHRVPAISRFKGLDEFDPSQITHAPPEEVESLQQPNEIRQAATENAPTSNVHKRTAAQRDNVNIAANMDAQLEDTAAVKKRKLNNTRPQETPVQQVQDSDDNSDDALLSAEAQKQRKLDVKAKMLAHRDEAEQERIRDEQALQDQLGGMDIKDIKPEIEKFEVKLSNNGTRQDSTSIRRAGWDPRWDGRANFKAFRPQGQRNANNGRKSVMVSLVEVPKKGFGLGEEYWLVDSRCSTQNRNSDRTSNGQSHGTTQPYGIHSHSNGTSVVEDSLNQISSSRSQVRLGKRAADEEAAGVAKKSRFASRFVNDDDDDDDGLQFRRKRR